MHTKLLNKYKINCMELHFVPVAADHILKHPTNTICNLELVSVAMTESKYYTIHLRQLS